MQRIVIILNILENNDFLSANTLANKLNVSPKTIRNDLKGLSHFSEEYGFEIKSKPRFGYKIEISDEMKFKNFKNKYQSPELGITNENRVAYTTMELLNTKKHKSIIELSEKLFVSKSTMHLILKNVKATLNAYDLSLEKRNNLGLKVIGTEEKIRQCICDLLLKSDLNKYYRIYRDDEKVEKISSTFSKTLKKFGVSLNEVSFSNFLLYLFVSIYRNKLGFFLENNENDLTNKNIVEKQIISELFEDLRVNSYILLETKEMNTFIYHLIGIRNSADLDYNLYGNYVNEDVYQLAVDMISLVDTEFNFNLNKNFDLRMNLVRHLIPLTIRLKFYITIKNPLVGIIKEQYSLAYVMAERASNLLSSKYKRSISEDEIAYIALIFLLGIEKEKNLLKEKKNIILICGSSTGSAHLLKYKFEQTFKEDLNEIKVFSINELKGLNLSNIDYIFTTVPILETYNVPIVRVGYFLDNDDVNKIKTILTPAKSKLLADYYSEDQFIGNLKASSKKEVLEKIFSIAQAKYNLSSKFYDSLLERELLARTTFGNRVAMPHTVETISDHSFVYLAILEKPVKWDNQNVQVIFLMNVGKKRGDELVKFYDLTMQFIMDKALVDQLIKHPKYELFMRILENLE